MVRNIFLAIVSFALSGCKEENETEVTQERVRAIKTYTVTEPASGDMRSYSATLVASDTSALSFSLTGTVESVNVTAGEKVLRGDVLATLDNRPFEFDRDAAMAELVSAQARRAEKQAELDRQSTLFERGWVAQAALDQAIAAAEGADAQLDLARSRLSTAERNLNNAVLTAPFDGVVASRDVDPFQDVPAGQALFQLNAQGALEIVASVPDAMVSRIFLGTTADVSVPTVAGCGCTARAIEIGQASGSANAVEIRAALLDGPAGLIPGMSAEIQITVESASSETGYLVPLTAIAPGDENAPGYVFIFDPAARVVRKTPVRGADTALNNLVSIV
ncbi:efflux RND transporter periplasmic adaptor subunit [Roseobacter denitrificans]|uniref:RND efflux membrane fusion protein, putative n=1 Tax=Roseobacter denitrificans (strain ATCC 33942 / OCh 114) TaxID=375451 RepID=Q16C50_ROSDO|nr:efflux RND transporter periplasmic adaptor subunit [Roseobacter denitrificans]ABG30443.1 RND efflux membrane fusion protein, putative [Roseobacter denitrificans OCh 114]AVL53595.1 efflux RND transporter periplasmic adaptor subunit [Roseobacter denitrificans]SFF72769.1 membrane fusion protein, multidrug efflux system [Roseobacter denitrificans OCh 114]